MNCIEHLLEEQQEDEQQQVNCRDRTDTDTETQDMLFCQHLSMVQLFFHSILVNNKTHGSSSKLVARCSVFLYFPFLDASGRKYKLTDLTFLLQTAAAEENAEILPTD